MSRWDLEIEPYVDFNNQDKPLKLSAELMQTFPYLMKCGHKN